MTIRRRGPKLKKAPEGYARFTEAAKLFEPLSKNVFNYRVRAGDIIVKEDTAGKLYEIASVINTKSILLQEQEKKKATPVNTIADWITIEDVLAGLKLDHIVYNEVFLADAAHYQERKKKNPRTSIGIFDTNDRGTMYAYISLLPLKEETIMDILLGKREENDIHSQDILTYDDPGEYTLLASSAVHHPDHPELITRLIRAFMHYWVDQYPKRRIKCIYAQTVSESGKLLANKLHMSTMYLMFEGHLQRIKDAYMLDLNEPAASKIIKEFQEKLRAKDHARNHARI
jgi:hypothetical protein